MQDFCSIDIFAKYSLRNEEGGKKKDSFVFFTTARNQHRVLHFIWVIKFWIIKPPSGFSELISANSQTSHATHSQAELVFGAGEWMGVGVKLFRTNTPSCGMPKRELRINLWANCNANAGRMIPILPTRTHTTPKKISNSHLLFLWSSSRFRKKRPKWSSRLQIETSHVPSWSEHIQVISMRGTSGSRPRREGIKPKSTSTQLAVAFIDVHSLVQRRRSTLPPAFDRPHPKNIFYFRFEGN